MNTPVMLVVLSISNHKQPKPHDHLFLKRKLSVNSITSPVWWSFLFSLFFMCSHICRTMNHTCTHTHIYINISSANDIQSLYHDDFIMVINTLGDDFFHLNSNQSKTTNITIVWYKKLSTIYFFFKSIQVKTLIY